MKVAIAVPLGEVVSDIAFNAFMAIAQKGWPMIQRGRDRTDNNRNQLAKQFLESSELDYILMLDADHVHPVDIVERHMRYVYHDPAKLVIGGLHYRRGAPFEPMVWVKSDDGLFHHPVAPPDGIFRCDAMAHCTLLVHRSVFDRIEYPWWRYDYDVTIDEESASEDIYFCKSCREAGIELWCDGTTTSPHIRQDLVTGAHFQQYMAEHPEQFSVIEIEQEVA